METVKVRLGNVQVRYCYSCSKPMTNHKKDICSSCENLLRNNNVILIEVEDGEVGVNPKRTGNFVAMPISMAETLLRMNPGNGRLVFMEKTEWRNVGLPTSKEEFDKMKKELRNG